MSYGIQVTMDNGKTFNTDAFSCNTYDVFVYNPNQGTYTKQYPELVGFNIYAFVKRLSNDALDSCSGVAISYPSGVPTVTCTLLSPAGATGLSGGSNVDSFIYVVVS